MRASAIVSTFFVLVCQISVAAPPKKLFDVTFQDALPGCRSLDIGFYEKLPRPDIVDKIVRESLDHAILIDPTVNILATGFLGENTLNSNQYSGSLMYNASQKKVMFMDEYRGVKVTTSNTNTYFVEVKEQHTVLKTKPVRQWLTVTIVFPKQPSQEAAYEAILVEAQKLGTKGLDVNAYVSVGDQKVKTSWEQMRDMDGAYVFANYDAASKKLMRKDKLLKQLP